MRERPAQDIAPAQACASLCGFGKESVFWKACFGRPVLRYDAIVVGLGAMGSAALCHLARSKLRVLGLERFEPGHERGSSHGRTRIIRQGYFEHPSYVPLVQRAYSLWRELERACGRKLLTVTGIAEIGRPDGVLVQGTLAASREHGLPHQVLTAHELMRLYPAFRLPQDYVAVVQPDGGFVEAEAGIRAHLQLAVAAGAGIRTGERVLAIEDVGHCVRVRTERRMLEAARVIVTAGAWTTSLLPELPLPLQATRQVLLWVRPSQPELFRTGWFPVFMIESADGIHYGFPLHGDDLMKVAKHHHQSEIVDPESYDRHVSEADEALVLQPLRRLSAGRRRPGRHLENLPLHDGAGRRFRDRPRSRPAQHRGRLALFRPRLQVCAGDRPGAGRTGLRRPHQPRSQPISDRPLHAATFRARRRPVTSLRTGRGTSRHTEDRPSREDTMRGLMQDWPLLCHRILDHAATFHPDRPIVSRSIEGPIHRTNYAQARTRALKVAQRLERDGIRLGDRVATLAWNSWRHFEAWYGIMGIGAIYHTVNPRLFPDQIAWIVNHAQDRVMMTDLTFVPLLEKLADRLPSIERYIVLTDSANMPKTSLKNAVAYEAWIGEVDGDFAWKSFDENTAAGMCYTSGTTGHPKGVRLFAPLQRAAFHDRDLRRRDGHFLARRGDAGGADVPRQLLGHRADRADEWCKPDHARARRWTAPRSIELLDEYRVTCTAAVPTIWLMLLQHLEATGAKLPHLKRVIIGGSACPRAITEKFEKNYDVEVIHAWGMTEMSPLGSLCTIKPEYAASARRRAARHQDEAGPSALRRRDEDHRRSRPRPALGRQDLRPAQGARDLRWRAAIIRAEDEEILDNGGLLRYRRRRHHRRPRLHADHRPLQGRDQVRRRMDFLDRSRKSRGRPSEGRRGRRDRHPPSEMGRAAAARRGPQEGPERRQGRNPVAS